MSKPSAWLVNPVTPSMVQVAPTDVPLYTREAAASDPEVERIVTEKIAARLAEEATDPTCRTSASFSLVARYLRGDA